MPLAWSLANELIARGTELLSGGSSPLRPDGKSQVTLRYQDGVPVGVEAIVLSWQHDAMARIDDIRQLLLSEIIDPVIPANKRTADCRLHLNPSGTFTLGGPKGDTGLTGRKIIVDTYGGAAPHGGGAFSGKDPSKVDRSAAYAARWVAKNVVAAGLADRATVQLAYAIGVAEPVSVSVEMHGTGRHEDKEIEETICAIFDLRPATIISQLDLKRPIYAATSSLGHFGRHRDPQIYRWERLDRVAELQSAIASSAQDSKWRLAKAAIRAAPGDVASDIFIEALMRRYRAHWAAPGGFKVARADHFGGCLRRYVSWYERASGRRASPIEISVAAEVMEHFLPTEPLSKKGMNPWVLDSDFPAVRERVEARLGKPEASKAASPVAGQVQ